MRRPPARPADWFPPEMAWSVHVAVPFDWKWSKNGMWVARRGSFGRRLSQPARDRRDSLAVALVAELGGQQVAHNVMWLEIFAELPDHRGDAINCLDLVADAVEIATGLNDRWVKISGLDWKISKDPKPGLHVWIGQQSIEDVQACGTCGLILHLNEFYRCRSAKLGRANRCKNCSSAKRNP